MERKKVIRAVPVRITDVERKWGPAMQALNERQRAFVIAAFTIGGDNHTAWALAAGYSDNGGAGITVHASRLISNPKILAAMREYADIHFQGAIPYLSGILLQIAGTKGHKDQIKAVTHALSLAGVNAVQEKKVTVEHVVSVKDKWLKVMRLAKQTGEDMGALLENLDPDERKVIEAEFQEIAVDAVDD